MIHIYAVCWGGITGIQSAHGVPAPCTALLPLLQAAHAPVLIFCISCGVSPSGAPPGLRCPACCPARLPTPTLRALPRLLPCRQRASAKGPTALVRCYSFTCRRRRRLQVAAAACRVPTVLYATQQLAASHEGQGIHQEAVRSVPHCQAPRTALCHLQGEPKGVLAAG